MKTSKIAIIFCLLLVTSSVLPLVFADVPLTSKFDQTGHYGIVAAGVGLRGKTSGTISIDVPGTVVAAYLYWSGYDIQTGGDNSVKFDGTAVTADQTYAGEWFSYYYHFVYVKDITALGLVNIGSDTYAVAELTLGVMNYGAGLLVVYEDMSLPTARIVILDGLDGFWFGWGSPVGPDSEVFSFDFNPASVDREANMFLFAGGTEHTDRPNEIYMETGTGTKPTNLVPPGGGALDGDYPLWASDGSAWDTYTQQVTLETGDEWLCVQVESIDNYEDPRDQPPYNGRGTSALLIATGLVIPIPGVPGGKVTGGGQIPIRSGGKGSFGFNAMWFSKDPAPKGELEYVDHDSGDKVHAHELDWLEVWEDNPGNKPWPKRYAFFSGPCTFNHESGYYFECLVEDDMEPGEDDAFKLLVYEDGNPIPIIDEDATLLHGNIQIHKPPK